MNSADSAFATASATNPTTTPASILDELEWRGLIFDCTHRDELARRLAAGPVTLYCGFDPTADSLHVGSLVPLLALRRFQNAGHVPLALAGGATGRIGDPSGRSSERQLLTPEILSHYVACIKNQLVRLLDFSTDIPNTARLLDNADWIAPVSFLDFLRDIGKHFTVNHMMAKESVRARMEDRDAGLSFTEFSYMLIQAADFLHLHREFGCELQLGGSDQWGNITAGLDLCRKKAGKDVYGLTLPLITTADGSKFGKSAGNAVWMDANKTSVYKFYQFWIRTDDRDVVRFLKFFTFFTREEIEELAARHEANPGAREAHKALATSVTTLVHGAQEAHEAELASKVLFGGVLDELSERSMADLTGEVPCIQMEASRFSAASATEGQPAGISLIDLLVETKLCPSKGQARKDIQGNGIYINNVRDNNPARVVGADALFFGQYLLLRKGKSNYAMIKTTK
ncbi:MAG: tyrosine--tRNA ligase [Candidatus Methylacidiphilales bacterium]|nr:tyrosine--tRNA ligase [Candidatus Methylacidiphilales bacterium]